MGERHRERRGGGGETDRQTKTERDWGNRKTHREAETDIKIERGGRERGERGERDRETERERDGGGGETQRETGGGGGETDRQRQRGGRQIENFGQDCTPPRTEHSGR